MILPEWISVIHKRKINMLEETNDTTASRGGEESSIISFKRTITKEPSPNVFISPHITVVRFGNMW